MVKEFDLDPTAEIWVLADFGTSQAVKPTRARELARPPSLSFAEAWLDSSEDYVAALGRFGVSQGGRCKPRTWLSDQFRLTRLSPR